AAVICSENYWKAETSSNDQTAAGTAWSGTRMSRVQRNANPSAGPANKRSKIKSLPTLPTSTASSRPQMSPRQSLRKAWASGSGYSNFPLWSAAPTTGWSAPPSIRSTRSSAARWWVTSP
ncbi:DDE-type integrase/transposase/recombinase, partial [Dysosmobacter welbionis]